MIRIAIICPSEIAFRRFLPALVKVKGVAFAGVAIASPQEWFGDLSNVTGEQIDAQLSHEHAKAQVFIDQYGGKLIHGYESLATSDEIDAIYVPLPPALHHRWSRLALQNDKHVFVEKPSTTTLSDTLDLIGIASEKRLVLHENYMFIYHSQLEEIQSIVKRGEIGDVRLYRILDVGGYCLKYANWLLGGDAHVVSAQSSRIDEFEVDMFGSATVENADGQTVQLAFGMDNDYRCEIEIWGSKGTITSGRILTAPDGFAPSYDIKKNQEIETCQLSVDDAFMKSIRRFMDCVENTEIRLEEYELLKKQSELVEEFRALTR